MRAIKTPELDAVIDLFENPKLTQATLDKACCQDLARILRAAVTLADAVRLEVNDCDMPLMVGLSRALDDWDSMLSGEGFS